MFPNGDAVFIANFNLYQCSLEGVFSITENVSELIWAYDEDSALEKLRNKYKSTENLTFQLLHPIVRRIIT